MAWMLKYFSEGFGIWICCFLWQNSKGSGNKKGDHWQFCKASNVFSFSHKMLSCFKWLFIVEARLNHKLILDVFYLSFNSQQSTLVQNNNKLSFMRIFQSWWGSGCGCDCEHGSVHTQHRWKGECHCHRSASTLSHGGVNPAESVRLPARGAFSKAQTCCVVCCLMLVKAGSLLKQGYWV